MSSLSDTLTIGVVLVLLFGSIALYLYTRIQQAEQKVNLLESILLDVKMSAEIKSYSDLPADDPQKPTTLSAGPASPIGSAVPLEAVSTEEYTTLDEMEKDTPDASHEEDSVYLPMEDAEKEQVDKVAEDLAAKGLANEEVTKDLASDSSNLLLHAAPLDPVEKEEISYENMTLKDLQTLAKSRHISGVSTMKKGALVDALKASQSDAIMVEEIFA